MTIRSSYLHRVFQQGGIKLHVDRVINRIRDEGLEFDSIAFRGVSGGLIAPAVCMVLDKYPIVVRKYDDEEAHSSHLVEGYEATARYLIIDDLIDTGDTIRQILRDVRQYLSRGAVCVGVITYDNYGAGVRYITSDRYE